MTQQEFNQLPLDQQLNILANVDVVGVPVCGCQGHDAAQSSNTPATEAQQIQQHNAPFEESDAAFHSRQSHVTTTTQTRTITITALRQQGDALSRLNPISPERCATLNSETAYVNILGMALERGLASGFTEQQLAFLAMCFEAYGITPAERQQIVVNRDNIAAHHPA